MVLNLNRKIIILLLMVFMITVLPGCDMDDTEEIVEPEGQYVLMVEVEGEGKVVLEDIDVEVDDFGEFEMEENIYWIEAKPAEGYRFSGWQEALADVEQKETTVVLEEDKKVKAIFAEKRAEYIINNIELSSKEIEQGESLTMKAEIENTGDREEEQDIELILSHKDRDEEITFVREDYSLASGDTDEIEFAGKKLPDNIEPGEYRVEVKSLDDSAAEKVVVFKSAYFDVIIQDYSVDLSGEEFELEVDYAVENIGDLEADKGVEFSVAETVEKEEVINLFPGDVHEDNFSYTGKAEDQLEFKIRSEDDHVSETLKFPSLDVEIEGEGEVKIEPDQERYEAGTEVKLEAIPDEDWNFRHWDGNVQDNNNAETEITMDEEKKITAVFADTINMPDGEVVTSFTEHDGSVRAVDFRENEFIISGGYDDETVKIWDAETGNIINEFSEHTHAIRTVAFAHDKELAASGASWRDSTARVWSYHTGEEEVIFEKHSSSGSVYSVDFATDDDKILSSGGQYDETVKVWNPQSGELYLNFTEHDDRVYEAVFSQEDDLIVSGDNESNIKLWDVNSGEIVSSYSKHSESVRSVDFSRNDDFVVSGSSDNTVKVWDKNQEEIITSFEEHDGTVYDVEFHPFESIVVSASEDETVKVWDVVTGETLVSFNEHDDRVRGVAFSENGKKVVSSSIDGKILVWE